MARLYAYVGPEEIRARSRGRPPGLVVRSRQDLAGPSVVTFVVDAEGALRVADRSSEHVACAGGGPVRAAGELFLEEDERGVYVAEASNQSTGYCPEPGCWVEVQRALDALGIPHPGRFLAAPFACTFNAVTSNNSTISNEPSG